MYFILEAINYYYYYMEVGKVEEEMDEELDTDMVVLGELGGKIFFI